MKPGDVARVLAKCNLLDRRFGEPSVEEAAAWYEVLHDLDGDDALAAVTRHYRVSRDQIMPADIRRHVAEIQAERRRRQPSPYCALPSRFENDPERKIRIAHGTATLRQVLGRIADHMATQRPALPSAMERLRELTADVEIIDMNGGEEQ